MPRIKDNQQAKDVLAASRSMSEAARKLGCSSQTMSRWIDRNGYPKDKFLAKKTGKDNSNYRSGKHCFVQLCVCGHPKDYRSSKCARCSRCSYPAGSDTAESALATDAAIAGAVKCNWTFLQAAKSLGVSRGLVTRAVERLGLDIGHFLHGSSRPYTDAQLFCAGHRYRVSIRRRYREKCVAPIRCTICGLGEEWRGKPITLHIDHINGDSKDNRLDNLRWLCPNCHEQQPTTRRHKMCKEREPVQGG